MRLSAIVCNYNHGAYVGQAVQSLLQQTRPPEEIIVVDDGSSDNSLEVLQALVADHPSIRLIALPQNVGVARAADRGLSEASGDLVTFPAADDVMGRQFYAQALELLERHPRAALAVGCVRDVYPASDGSPARSEFPSFQNATIAALGGTGYVPPERALAMETAYLPLGLMGYASVFRRSALATVLPFPREAGHLVDWLYMRALAYRFGYCFVAEACCDRLVLEDSMSSTASRSWARQRAAFQGVLQHLASPAYRDCLPFFIESGALAVGGYRTVIYMMLRPRYWTWIRPRLLMKGLVHLAASAVPPAVKEWMRRLQIAGARR